MEKFQSGIGDMLHEVIDHFLVNIDTHIAFERHIVIDDGLGKATAAAEI